MIIGRATGGSLCLVPVTGKEIVGAATAGSVRIAMGLVPADVLMPATPIIQRADIAPIVALFPQHTASPIGGRPVCAELTQAIDFLSILYIPPTNRSFSVSHRDKYPTTWAKRKTSQTARVCWELPYLRPCGNIPDGNTVEIS